jgi:hypothetical protein
VNLTDNWSKHPVRLNGIVARENTEEQLREAKIKEGSTIFLSVKR